jgi:hypothetical protein
MGILLFLEKSLYSYYIMNMCYYLSSYNAAAPLLSYSSSL